MELYEDVAELRLPAPEINPEEIEWRPYNPRKPIKRYGASITSLDGGTSGIPDLDSLYEFNLENGTNFREADFRAPTKYASHFSYLFENFKVGRSHFLRLESGGFFPYHRDLDPQCIRLVYCVQGCSFTNLAWILGETVLKMADRRWFYVNTKKPHALFSFFGSTLAVFNIIREPDIEFKLGRLMEIR